VSSISNNIEFEMPTEIFTTIEDLERVQIALNVLPSDIITPKIFLDSMWLEIEYENAPEEESNQLEEKLAKQEAPKTRSKGRRAAEESEEEG